MATIYEHDILGDIIATSTWSARDAWATAWREHRIAEHDAEGRRGCTCAMDAPAISGAVLEWRVRRTAPQPLDDDDDL